MQEEFLPQLANWRATQVYREMRDNDPVIGGMLFAVDMMLRQVEWWIEPASSSAEDEKAAEFVEECRCDMDLSWSDFVSEALSMLPFGFAPFEIVYKKRRGPDSSSARFKSKYTDGKIGWRKFGIRAQETVERWEFDKSGAIIGLWQQAPPIYERIFIPVEKLLLFRTTLHKNNPEGRSILRNAYRPWYFKRRLEEIEAIGIERDLAGFPLMYVDPDILAADATAAKKAILAEYQDAIVNIRRDSQEGLLIPAIFDEHGNRLYQLELVSSGGQRQFDTNAIVNRYDQRITTTIMADFILLGQQAHGSFALSSDKTGMFALALKAWLQIIASVLNEEALPRLFRLNGMSLDSLPKFRFSDIESPDLGSLGNFVQVMANSGAAVFPDVTLENHLRELASLPRRDENASFDSAGPVPLPGQSGMGQGPEGADNAKKKPDVQGAAAASRRTTPQPTKG